jgi:hypothetical protein
MMLALAGCGTSTVPAPAEPTPAAVSSRPGDVIPGAARNTAPSVPRIDRKTARANPTVPQEKSVFQFAEIAQSAGIDFKQVSGTTREKHFPSANGSGAAVFDYNGDGILDLYFATGNYLPLGSQTMASNRLYRGLGDLKYEDVTGQAGVGFQGFCHGVIVGDFDNDGDPDLYLANYGPNVFYLNNGDGTFRDVTTDTGTSGGDAWSSGGATFDMDNDGDLDFYVTNYGEWIYERDKDRFCGNHQLNVRQYCSPKEIKTVKHFMFRNDGVKDGIPRFTNVLDEAGMGRSDGHGFGVVTADLNEDGLIDVYVANDQNPAFLFLNKGDGTFRDATEESGAAYDEKGNAQAGMGVDAEDIDGDGKPELFKTHFKDEYNTLYQNLGGGTFYDQTPSYGLAADSQPWVGWGCVLGDFDNDTWPDCFVTNGHVDDNYAELGLDVPYEEPPLLHRNVPLGSAANASRRFRLATREAGAYLESSHVGRGLAYGDLDDDGDLDLVIVHKDAPPALLRNDTPAKNHWLRLKLTGTRSNRDAIGAQVTVTLPDGREIHRQRKGGTSVLSSHDPRLLIGVGEAEVLPKVVIRWPSKTESVLENVKVDQTVDVVEPKDGAVAAVSGTP